MSSTTARRIVIVAVGLIGLNYLAQVPYNLYLYGTSFSPHGFALLALTCVWFAAGVWLLLRDSVVGWWLTVSFSFVEFSFYLYNTVGGWRHGYGLFFHLYKTHDSLLWAVFAIGYVNLFAAAALCLTLLLRPAPQRKVATG